MLLIKLILFTLDHPLMIKNLNIFLILIEIGTLIGVDIIIIKNIMDLCLHIESQQVF